MITERTCIYCGERFAPPKPTTELCRGCYYNGRHLEAEHRGLIEQLRALRGVFSAEVEHTGGGCFGLSVTLDREGGAYFFGTVAYKDEQTGQWYGEVGLPSGPDERWFVSCNASLDAFSDGQEPLATLMPLTDEEVVAAIARALAAGSALAPAGRIEDMNLAVFEELRRRGTKAFFEYPGVIHIPLADETALWTSNQNATWTIDRQTKDGACTLASLDTAIPSVSTAVAHIADAIAAAIAAPPKASNPSRENCAGCGGGWNADDSDAKDPMTYCSRECEQRDHHYMDASGR